MKLKKPKKFIKGGRLYMYPPNFNLYRISRGIKPPKKEYYQYSYIKEKAGLTEPTYSKAIALTDDKSFNSKIIYEYYNTKRKEKIKGNPFDYELKVRETKQGKEEDNG